ncbi:MAG: hypothetical protein PHV59_02740 [Victivallales bacterium]|nr:hypothetical protein [Victivallales bacterium]
MATDKNRISLDLKNNKYSYHPGEEFRGEIKWDFSEEVPEIIVKVFWYTEGLAPGEAEIVRTKKITLPLKSGRQNFSLELPLAPYSYQGQLSSLGWAIEAGVPKGRINTVREFTLAPTGNRVNLTEVKNAFSILPKFIGKKYAEKDSAS